MSGVSLEQMNYAETTNDEARVTNGGAEMVSLRRKRSSSTFNFYNDRLVGCKFEDERFSREKESTEHYRFDQQKILPDYHTTRRIKSSYSLVSPGIYLAIIVGVFLDRTANAFTQIRLSSFARIGSSKTDVTHSSQCSAFGVSGASINKDSSKTVFPVLRMSSHAEYLEKLDRSYYVHGGLFDWDKLGSRERSGESDETRKQKIDARMAAAAVTKRPRNRPSSVPGATTRGVARRQTAIAVAEAEEARARAAAKKKDTKKLDRKGKEKMVAVEVIQESKTPVLVEPVKRRKNKMASRQVPLAPALPKRKKRGRPRKTQTAASTSSKRQLQVLPDGVTAEMKKRAMAESVQNRSARPDKLNLAKFYRTKLLSADEEFELGMQVRFMVKCDEVHDGLCTQLLRLPTIMEWAEACGFQSGGGDKDVLMKLDESTIRPAGSEEAFPSTEELNRQANMFVGNVGLGVQGPGRGHSRREKAKKKLVATLDEEIFASAQEYFPHLREGKEEDEEMSLSTRDFVETMLKARAAKHRMVQCNMRLVVSIARRYHSVEGISVQDLVQEGSMGLMRAAEKFDPTKGFKFSTYASWWIQQAIFRSMAYHSRNIRLPVHVHNLLSRIRRVRSSLQHELGRTPTTAEVAKEVDMTPEKLAKLIRLTRRSISMDMPKYRNNPKDLGHASEESVGDSIDSTSPMIDNNSPELSVDHTLFQDDLKDMLSILGDDERTVICLRYGIGTGFTRTVTAVAERMRRTKSWVRSQECRALRKLRRPWYEKRLREHQNSLQG